MTDSIVQIIEDEPLHANLLERALRQAHFSTALDADGHSGWNNVQRLQPSLILLDVMLPGMNGHEICRLVRGTPATRHIPIIMLTAVGTEEDRIAGLEMGADDYVVKPFSPREVVSRVQAVLRRVREKGQARPLVCSDTSLTLEGPFFVVSLQERHITVSNPELRLLQYLLTQDGQLVHGDVLLNLPGEDPRSRSREEIEHRIRFLRRKLENSGAGSIEIFPGFRYRFLAHPGRN